MYQGRCANAVDLCFCHALRSVSIVEIMTNNIPENRSEMNVLILSCGTGEGHNSAARALAENLTERGISCEVRDSVSFKSEKSQRKIANLYMNVIRNTPSLFGFVYKLGAAYEAMFSHCPIYTYNARYADKLYSYIKEKGFNLVICTHTFSMMTMTAVREKFAPDLPCYGVLTDYTAIPFYRYSRLDGYFVANDKTRYQLKRIGKKDEIIHCLGIPVGKKFAVTMTKDEAKDCLGIPHDKKVVVVLSGGAGCGKILSLSQSLDKMLGDDHLVCVFTGRNDKLKVKMDKRFGSNDKFKIIEFTPDVSLYLKAADIAFSKPGGLSSTEIAVANVPFVQLKAIPGCETENKKHFTSYGLAVYASTIKKAVRSAHTVMTDERVSSSMLENQKLFVNPNSNDLILEKIMELQNIEQDCLSEERI